MNDPDHHIATTRYSIDKDEFAVRFGSPPQDLELAMVNCARSGEVGHELCGICEHGTAACLCPFCLLRFPL